jgi:outer membrane protein
MTKLFLTFIFCVYPFYHALGISIKDALKLYVKNETYINATQELELAKTQEAKVFGDILPSLELNSNYTKQSSTQNDFVGSTQRQTFLTLRQPLFRGLKEFAALDYAQKLLEIKKLTKEAVKREVQMLIANHFMLVYQLKQELALSKELIEINQKNYEFIKQRQKIGRSKKSDLLVARATLLSSRSELYQQQEQLKKVILDLSRVIQTPLESFEYSLKDMDSNPNMNIDTHPSVVASKILYEATEQQIKIAKSGHYPTVDLSANYYLEQEGTFNQRDWDMAVNLTFPIFSGNKTSKEIVEQKIVKQQNQNNYLKTRNDLKVMMDKIFMTISLAKKQLRAYEASTAASLSGYKEVLKDYKLRLTTNLELNSSLQNYIQEKKKLIQIQAKEKLAKVQIAILNGEF